MKSIINKKKHYELDFLIQHRIAFVPNIRGIEPRTIVNGIYLLFPVGMIKDVKIKSTWGCKCFCGNYFITNYSAVSRGITTSCGCVQKMRNTWRNSLLSIKLAKENNILIDKLPTEYRSRDGIFTCKTCLSTTNKGSLTDHLKQGKKFCKCSFTYKYSYVDIKEECKSHEEKTTWNILYFPEDYEKKENLFLPVSCKECNTLNLISYQNFKKARGCRECANKETSIRFKKNSAYFIEKSIDRHGFSYDYSEVDYIDARTHVLIKCRKDGHKPFLQTPDNHYNKGKGCPDCKKIKLKNVHFHLKQVEVNKGVYKATTSGIYIMEVGNMIKIGITVRPEVRVKDIARSSGFTSNIIFYKELDLYNALHLEKSLHEHYDEYQQKDYNFEGHTECFYLSNEEIPIIKDSINSWKTKI